MAMVMLLMLLGPEQGGPQELQKLLPEKRLAGIPGLNL